MICFDLFYCYSKYHYSVPLLLFCNLVCSCWLYTILILLYCISLIIAYNYVVLFLTWRCAFSTVFFLIPLFLSALSLFVCSHKNEFLNKKTVVTCACIEPGAVKPELLTKQGNIDSALHVSYVGGGGGISSSIMSFFCIFAPIALVLWP